MAHLSFDRYCAEIVTQTDLLRSRIDGADLTAPVPSCPDWNLGQLLRHLGGAHRWVETIVRTRATQPPFDEQVRDISGYTDDPAVLDTWLAEGATQLVDTLSIRLSMIYSSVRIIVCSDCSDWSADRRLGY